MANKIHKLKHIEIQYEKLVESTANFIMDTWRILPKLKYKVFESDYGKIVFRRKHPNWRGEGARICVAEFVRKENGSSFEIAYADSFGFEIVSNNFKLPTFLVYACLLICQTEIKYHK